MKTKIVLSVIALLALLVFVVLTYFYIDFSSGRQKADKHYKEAKVKRILNMGSTRTLDILPLVDWYTDRGDLKGEAGVSYLLRTDESLILFDVGMNAKNEDTSPLLHNMKQLGIDLAKIDVIVISHNHPDHVGGFKWSRRKSFSLTNHQINLGNKRVYTPVPMTYPGLNPISTDEPTIIAKGVATTGTISTYLFFTGWTPEQALAINVAGKGIVLIVGCGHQTVPRLIERTRLLFDEPIYGIVGGLHYPVTDSRMRVMGIPVQTIFGTGKPPWSLITVEDVNMNIEALKQTGPSIVAISAHDSCDASIDAFRKAFPSAYRDVRVGKKLAIER
jgi:7,8-dihydropterin-6-yl-methyl-4-(beta-D-ribofuranosyl)aminobenzene 5'-phosphate synthase